MFRSWFRLHRVAGRWLALFWLIAGCTGLLSSMGPRLDANLIANPPVSPNAAIRAAKELAGSGRPSTIMFPTVSFPDYVVMLRRTRENKRFQVLVSATTGVARMRQGRDAWGWITEVHESLALAAPGRWFLILSGCGLLAIATTGLLMWLSRRARPRGFHRTLGAIAAIPLLVVATSGVFLEAHDALRVERSADAASAKGAMSGSHGRRTRLPDLDRAVAIAERALPGQRVIRVNLPVGHDAPLTLSLQRGTIRDPLRETEVSLDAKTLAVRSVVTPSQRTAPERLTAFVTSLHTGAIGGAATLWLDRATGLALIVLAVTGFSSDRRRLQNERNSS